MGQIQRRRTCVIEACRPHFTPEEKEWFLGLRDAEKRHNRGFVHGQTYAPNRFALANPNHFKEQFQFFWDTFLSRVQANTPEEDKGMAQCDNACAGCCLPR